MALLVAAAFALRHRLPMFSLGLFWFLGAHLLTSSVLPLELVFEHRNYFALLGVLLAIAELVDHNEQQSELALASAEPKDPAAARAALAAAVAADDPVVAEVEAAFPPPRFPPSPLPDPRTGR